MKRKKFNFSSGPTERNRPCLDGTFYGLSYYPY